MKKLLFLVTIAFVFITVSFGMIDSESSANFVEKLRCAIKNNDVKKVQKLLLEEDNLIFLEYKSFNELLSLAIKGKNFEIIKLLRRIEITPEMKALFKAVEDGEINKVKRLLSTKKLGVNIPNEDGNTSLMIAVLKNNIPMAEELLRMKSGINIRNNYGQTSITLAIDKSNLKMLQTLLNNSYYLNIDIDQLNNNGDTPLMLALKTNNIDFIKAILAEVPDLSIMNNKKKTVQDLANSIKNKKIKSNVLKLLEAAKKQFNFYKAIKKNNIEEVKKLISDISLNITTIERNPLIAATKKENLEMVKLLVNNDAKVNQKLKLGITPLLLGVLQGNLAIVNFLLNKGADPNILGQIGFTPLFFAAYNDNLQMINLLVKSGANINQPVSFYFDTEMPNDMTPLMTEAYNNKTDFVRVLLELGANPLLKNPEGQTALDIAVQKGYQVIIDLLKEAIRIGEPLFSKLRNLTQRLKALQKVL